MGKDTMTAALVSGLLALAAPAAAQDLYPLPAHPEGLEWPTEAWPTGGDAPDALAPLVEEAMVSTRAEALGESRAVVVVHGGRIVAEAYGDGFGPDTKLVSWSMAKSITSALVGRAVQLGLIESVDDVMPTPFPGGDPRGDRTWTDWLTMTDGLDNLEIYATSLSESDAAQSLFGKGRKDVAAYAVEALDVAHAPGEHWNYSTLGLTLVGRAAGLALDPDEPAPADDFDRVLFDPIGADIQPEFDATGNFLGGALAWASAHDYAKFGYLHLRDGVWDGTRLLPEGWVDFVRTRGPAENGNTYGAGFWVMAPEGEEPVGHQGIMMGPYDAFHAGGSEGQIIWIVPSRDLVVVRLGVMQNTEENWTALHTWAQTVAGVFPEVAGE